MRHQACNDSPYHLAMLLLWGAHMNLQQVTQSAWSSYVLTESNTQCSVSQLAICDCNLLHQCQCWVLIRTFQLGYLYIYVT